MTTREQTRTELDNADIRSTVEQLIVAIRRLPECSDAAKLRGIGNRLADAVHDGSDSLRQACRLAAAARDALEVDPWVVVDGLARRLREMCEAAGADNTPQGPKATQEVTDSLLIVGETTSERRRIPNQAELRKRRAEQEEQWHAQGHRRNVGRFESAGDDSHAQAQHKQPDHRVPDDKSGKHEQQR